LDALQTAIAIALPVCQKLLDKWPFLELKALSKERRLQRIGAGPRRMSNRFFPKIIRSWRAPVQLHLFGGILMETLIQTGFDS
jgi:hypothetical protein